MAKKPVDPEKMKKVMRRRGAKYQHARRVTRAKVQEELDNGHQDHLTKEDPPLLDAMDLVVGEHHLHPNNSYRPEYCTVAEEIARLGGTDIELARALGKSLSTIWGWQGRHEEFFRACILGKDLPNKRVERALYNRAVGYSYPEIKLHVIEGTVVATPVLTHIPPDVAAATRWLKSRDRENWGDEAKLQLSADESFQNIWKAISAGQTVALTETSDAASEE
jgi:hypothetical protein